MQHTRITTRDEQLNYWYPDSNWLGIVNDPMSTEEISPQGTKRKAESELGGDKKRQLNQTGNWAIPTKFTAIVSNVSEMQPGERGCPIDVEGESSGPGLHSSPGEAQGKPYSRLVRYRFLICE